MLLLLQTFLKLVWRTWKALHKKTRVDKKYFLTRIQNDSFANQNHYVHAKKVCKGTFEVEKVTLAQDKKTRILNRRLRKSAILHRKLCPNHHPNSCEQAHVIFFERHPLSKPILNQHEFRITFKVFENYLGR